MSFVNQKVRFSEGSRCLTLESDPNTINALETIATVLGATEDRITPHNFKFNPEKDKLNIPSLNAIEIIWEGLPASNISDIHISYGNEYLTLEGDDQRFKVFISLIHLFEIDIEHGNKVSFLEEEQISFNTICYFAERLGILPA